MTGSNEFKLNQGPDDSISAVKFSPNTTQFLLVSSWDSSVRLYDVGGNSLRMKYQHTGPVLDCAYYVRNLLFSGDGMIPKENIHAHDKLACCFFQDPTHAWSGGLDCQLKMHDLNTDQGMY